VHGELVPVPRSARDVEGPLAPAVQTTRVGLGLAGLVARGAHLAVTGHPWGDTAAPRGPALVAGAALGLAMEAERRAAGAADAVAAFGSTAARGVARLPGVDDQVRRFESWLLRWDAHARVQQRRNRAEADAVVRRVVEVVADFVLEHVDFAHVVERIPMDEIVDKIDIDAVMDRLDLGAIVDKAMKDIDIGGLIRESTEGVTAEAVDVVRSQTVKTDLFVSRIVDRVLFRKSPRDLSVHEGEPEGDAQAEPEKGGTSAGPERQPEPQPQSVSGA
jgi:hypothetical protein